MSGMGGSEILGVQTQKSPWTIPCCKWNYQLELFTFLGWVLPKPLETPRCHFLFPPKKNHPGLLVPPTSPCRFWAGSLISMRLIAVIGRLAVGVGAAGMFSGRGEDAPAVILVAGLWFCVQRAPRNPKVSPWFRLKTHLSGVEMLISTR